MHNTTKIIEWIKFQKLCNLRKLMKYCSKLYDDGLIENGNNIPEDITCRPDEKTMNKCPIWTKLHNFYTREQREAFHARNGEEEEYKKGCAGDSREDSPVKRRHLSGVE